MKEDERCLLLAIAAKEDGVSVRVVLTVLHDNGTLHYKRGWYILEKWSRKYWYEYGVNLELGWLTKAGKQKVLEMTDAALEPPAVDGGGREKGAGTMWTRINDTILNLTDGRVIQAFETTDGWRVVLTPAMGGYVVLVQFVSGDAARLLIDAIWDRIDNHGDVAAMALNL